MADELDTYFQTTHKLYIKSYLTKIIGKANPTSEISNFLNDLCNSKTIDLEVKKDVLAKMAPHFSAMKRNHLSFQFDIKKLDFYMELVKIETIADVEFRYVEIEHILLELFNNPKCVASFSSSHIDKLLKKDITIIDNPRFLGIRNNSDLKHKILRTLLEMGKITEFKKLKEYWRLDFEINVNELYSLNWNEHVVRYVFQNKCIRMTYIKTATSLPMNVYIIFCQYVKFWGINEEEVVSALRSKNQYAKICKQYDYF